MKGGAPLGRTRLAPILANSAAFASYPGMEVLNSSSVPRVKFIVEYENLIFAGISVSRSSSCPASGRLVGRTVPTRYSLPFSAMLFPPGYQVSRRCVVMDNVVCNCMRWDLITCVELASSATEAFGQIDKVRCSMRV